MDKKSQKAYEKAMNLYESGEIDKALDICENALSEELNNSSFLNFKGLLLYQQGKLNEAITVWKLNEEFNKDVTASKYIRDSQKDFEKLNAYRDGEKALRNLNVDLAFSLFSTCLLSDFNLIKVNTGLAACYQKKGNYDKALQHIERVLQVDKNYEEAIRLKKEILEFSNKKPEKSTSKKALTFITAIFIIIVLCGAGFAIYMRITNEHLFNNALASLLNNNDNVNSANENKDKIDKKDNQIEDTKTKDNEKAESNSNKESEPIETEQPKESNSSKIFDKDKVEQMISSSDVDGLCDELKGVNKDNILDSDMYLYRQAIDLINEKGVVNYYNKGLEYYNEKKYEDAEVQFNRAYDFCENNSYKEHILFYRASNFMKLSKTQEAVKQYEEYYKEYPKGVYSEGVLYELILLYDSHDKDKSRQYANELVNNFPKSIYINDNVRNVLNN